MGLSVVPRVASHRGFLFASLKPEGESLAEFLGGAAAQFDMLVDASPTGEIFLDAGVNKTEYLGNWKLVGMDGYHPNRPRLGRRFVGRNRNPASAPCSNLFSAVALTPPAIRPWPCHVDFRAQRLKSYASTRLPGQGAGRHQYVEDMHKAYGKDRAELLISLSGDRTWAFRTCS
jgi:phenylpropionate dioxygenase-like ring-hydroxylating dioxygenase large terminal subunit